MKRNNLLGLIIELSLTVCLFICMTISAVNAQTALTVASLLAVLVPLYFVGAFLSNHFKPHDNPFTWFTCIWYVVIEKWIWQSLCLGLAAKVRDYFVGLASEIRDLRNGKVDDYLEKDNETGKYRENAEQSVRDEVEKNHWRNVGLTILKDWRLYLMLIPMLLVFLFWRYFPMYELLGAFKFKEEAIRVAEQNYTGFYYFKMLFSHPKFAPEFWRAFRNTFLLSFYGLLFGFPTPIIIALFFNEIKSNMVRSVYQVITYLPKFISTVVMTSLIAMLVRQPSSVVGIEMGVISQLLVNIGAISADSGVAGLLNNPDYFRAIYQISGIWETAGYDSIVFFAAIIAISPTSYEAAQIDGAGKMAQMRYVVLPSILSTIVIMLITRIGSLLNIGYEKVLLLYNDQTYATADVVSTFAQRYGLGEGMTGLASAAEMMNNVVGMLLVISANTIARKASDVSLY